MLSVDPDLICHVESYAMGEGAITLAIRAEAFKGYRVNQLINLEQNSLNYFLSYGPCLQKHITYLHKQDFKL